MPSEQANAFKKHRDADDAPGNLTWAARLQSKGIKASPEALARIDVEREFELSEDERVRLAIGHTFGCPLPLPVIG